jgi:tetratricopeptide (TPR) repeat protein
MPRTSFATSTVLLLAVAVLTASCSDPQVKKQDHLKRGDQYAAEKKDDFAVIEYANAVRLDPKFGEARWKLAQTLERMNDFRAAFPEYVRAADALPNDRDAQIKATEILLVAGRFEDAKTRATALLTKNPQDVQALVLRANAMVALKDPAGALAEIEEALRVKPDDSRTLVNLGAIRMDAGDSKEAEAAFRQAIAVNPSSVDGHLALANYLWAAGRGSEAEQSIKHALSLAPQHLLANRMLGILYIATRRPDQAEQPLKIVAEISKAPAARFRLADYYLGVKRVDEAKRLLAELAADQSSSAAAELRLAAIDYDENRPAEAHKRLDGLLTRAPGYAPALGLKAKWLTSENKLDEALVQANAAVSADPNSAAAHFTLGVVHDRRREGPDAVKSFNEVLRLNPRAAAAQIQLSRLNLSTGDRDAALRHAEEAKQAEPTNAAARIVLARTLLARGDLARAEIEISELLRVLPNQPDVQTLNGSLQARRRNFPDARKSFERAVQVSPGHLDGIAGLVGLDVEAKQIPAATSRIEAELAKQPDRAELLILAAQVYRVSGNFQKAEQALRRAVTIEPRLPSAYGMLAELYIQQQRLDEARAEFEAMSKRDAKAAGPRTMVGVILEAQGKRDEAKRWYEATVAAGNNAPVVANNLAMLYAEDGTNLDMALQLATAAKQGLPDNPDIDDTLGWVYYKKNLPALAVGPFQESLKKRPDTAEVLYHLGLAYAKMGDNSKAREALEHALKLDPNFPGHNVARETLVSVNR